ncbi:uncharacterized protein LOC141690847 [Apium graveolens]|uniref:uncharacterized protein LOC141690847 n=1 Tax=Apium graveolens TaxID=4045 RepID=UPI003D7B2253
MTVYSDSQIVVKQTSGEYVTKDPTLAQYQAMVRNILEATPDITILQVNREENSKVDELSKLVQNTSDLASSVYFEEFKAPSTERAEEMPPVSKVQQRSQAKPSLPASVLSPITFAVWGIDIMGPFPRAKGDLRYVLVAIDYMTKWAEAKAMRTINQQDCIKFMDSIVMRFGIPIVLVSDNGPQFVGSDFEAYLKELGIKHKRASVAHPQGNGQVEVTNRTILRGLEKRLEESKKTWPDELPKVLWSYRITPRTGTNETPFKLAYDTEAHIPIKTGSPSHRVMNFDEISNIEGLKTNLELLDEVRDKAVKRMEGYKEKTKLYFGKKAKFREYEAGDLVLGHTEASDLTNQGKLQPNWEGPYRVKEVLRPETYKLSYLGGTEVPNTWHGARLRKFYQ